eukprot:1082982-Amphidinium_carterae.1
MASPHAGSWALMERKCVQALCNFPNWRKREHVRAMHFKKAFARHSIVVGSTDKRSPPTPRCE